MEKANLKLWRDKLSCHDPAGMFSGNERKRDGVGREKSSMQITSNSV